MRTTKNTLQPHSRATAEQACSLESERLCASQRIRRKQQPLRCQMLMQDAVVARQYINDNGSFQRQARLWTGQRSGASSCLLQ